MNISGMGVLHSIVCMEIYRVNNIMTALFSCLNKAFFSLPIILPNILVGLYTIFKHPIPRRIKTPLIVVRTMCVNVKTNILFSNILIK